MVTWKNARVAGPPDALSSSDVALSRRTLLRLTGVAAAVVVLAPACSASSSSSSAEHDESTIAGSTAADEADPLRAMGRSLAAGPQGQELAGQAPDGLASHLTDPAAVVSVLAQKESDIRNDFAQSRTVVADGWLVSRTEAVTLVAYAGT